MYLGKGLQSTEQSYMGSPDSQNLLLTVAMAKDR